MSDKKRILLAVTGASGMPYAKALAQALHEMPDVELHLIISEAGRKVATLECECGEAWLESEADVIYRVNEYDAGPASGSWRHAGMIVCPCTMASLAAIASGMGQNLIHRAADVTLKERRKLVLVPRETPLNEIHLKNMLAAHQAGAIILPACPGFYHKPASIEELTRFLAGRILDQLGLPHNLCKRWKEQN